MINRKWKNLLLILGVLGMLLVGGGCMHILHPGHNHDGPGEVQTTGSPKMATEDGAKGDLAPSPSNAQGNPPATPSLHHGVNPRSPWTWLIGGGMVVMMVLMVL